MNKVTLLKGDCLQKLKELEDNSVDSVVTDPPYEIGFMGKGWDDSGIANNPELWKEVLRVLKPGGHLLSFSHSRTYHRQAVAVEDAGFEIRDQIMWIYGSGFPKSHNIGKSVDKIEGNQRVVVGETKAGKTAMGQNSGWNQHENRTELEITKGNSDWEGWGTALKPAHEPIVMARKPFKGTVAQNVLEHGTGGINVDGCRIGNEEHSYSINGNIKSGNFGNGANQPAEEREHKTVEGRFPANIIFGHNPDCKLVGYDEEIVIGGNKGKSGFVNGYEKGDFTKEVKKVEKWECSDGCAVKILDEQSGISKSLGGKGKISLDSSVNLGGGNNYFNYGDTGGASRFFYCPKSSKKDRNEGLDHITPTSNGKIGTTFAGNQTTAKIGANPNKPTEPQSNIHPTVKPTDLMAYLIRLITPKGGIVLDPFMGSGSTGKAAVREGMSFIGIEREDEYMEIAKSRIEHEQKKNKHTEFFNI